MTKDIREKLVQADVPEELVKLSISAYDFLSDKIKCPKGEAYSWDIVREICQLPTTGFSFAKERAETAIRLLEYHNFVQERRADGRYVLIKSRYFIE